MSDQAMAMARPPPRRRTIAANGVVAMVVFVLAETMFFAGLVSAFGIAKAAAFVDWPPPGQPRLPVAETALNTLALLASGLMLALAWRAREDAPRLRRRLLGAIILGTFFVLFQGVEWVALLRQGLTVTTSTHAGFFYIVVGAHAAHAIGALIGLGYVYRRALRERMEISELATVQVLWYFVVALWPILYVRVYL